MPIRQPPQAEGDDPTQPKPASPPSSPSHPDAADSVSGGLLQRITAKTDAIFRSWKWPAPPALIAWLPLLCAACIVSGIWIGTYLKREKAFHIIQKANYNANDILGQSRIEEVIRYIEAKYVDDKDRSEMVDGAIQRFLEYLDPHSSYIPPEELNEINEQMYGSFDGIGVELLSISDTLHVVSVLASGPAARAGLLAGDKILEIDGIQVAGPYAPRDSTGRLLSGKRGTRVNVIIRRDGSPEPLPFSVTRTEIPIRSINAAYMINAHTAFIRIVRFNARTAAEFKAHLDRLVTEQQAKDLIIDVRQNPGGYLTEATDILDELFTAKDKLLVYTEGRTVHRSEYRTTGNARHKWGKIAVLIDEGSASASEVIAGAIQDLDRGIVVGRRSYGKGLVQEQYSLSNDGALRLTVARYFTPSGRCIQRPYNDYKPYEMEYQERLSHGELTSQIPAKISDSTRYFTSKGRVVYGGGGIIPDFVIPLESYYTHPYYNAIRQEAQAFVLQYYVRHRRQFRYTIASFRRDFRISDALMTDFFHYCERKGIAGDQRSMVALRQPVRNLLKAHFARQLFTEEAYFIEMNDRDPVVLQALRHM